MGMIYLSKHKLKPTAPLRALMQNWLSSQTCAARPQKSLLTSSGYPGTVTSTHTETNGSKEDLQSLQPYTNKLNSGFKPAELCLSHQSYSGDESSTVSGSATSYYHLFPMMMSLLSFGGTHLPPLLVSAASLLTI